MGENIVVMSGLGCENPKKTVIPPCRASNPSVQGLFSTYNRLALPKQLG